MTFPSDIPRLSDKQRESNSQAATDAFMDWARKAGKTDVYLQLKVRDCAIAATVLAYHAATLVVDGGDPELMLALAQEFAAPLRIACGPDETQRVLELLATMFTGLEP